MKINIHGKDTFMKNLGLIPITGSFTATAALIIMENCFQQNNGMEMSNHIFASTANGASVKRQCGRLSEAKGVIHMRCL